MKKLNNKGYLLVEIIVASVLAMTIAYFLIDLTLNLKEKNDDVFVDTILVTDKVLMTDVIQEDIDRYNVTKISQPSDNMLDIIYLINGSDITKRISVLQEDNQYIFKYGVVDAGGNYDDTVYQKEFNEALDVDRIVLSNTCYNEESDTYVYCSSSANNSNGIMTIKISAYTLYSDFDYGINISVPYKTSDIEVEKYTGPREIVDEIKELGIKECGPFDKVATTDEGVCTALDDYGTSYVFRGAVQNNYVKFGKWSNQYIGYNETGQFILFDTLDECNSDTNYNINCTSMEGKDMYWRIIRINGDGSIRMIYDGTVAHANGESSMDRQIGKSLFNMTFGDVAYLGYMMGVNNECDVGWINCPGRTKTTSYSQATANTYNSTIKTAVDNWYKTNIEEKGYSDYLADVIYCNDRQIDNLSGYGTALGYGANQTAYMAYNRLYTNKSPVLTCTNKNDRFTVSDTSRGNGVLTYPVGLITADEVSMGGGVYLRDNSSYYLYTGQDYWTMSPAIFYDAAIADDFRVSSAGFFGRNGVYFMFGVRPVISLKADTIFSGIGTIDDPYVVEMD